MYHKAFSLDVKLCFSSSFNNVLFYLKWHLVTTNLFQLYQAVSSVDNICYCTCTVGANTKTIYKKYIFRQSPTVGKLFYSRCVLLFRPYLPTINFLECWMHLSDGSAKVLTLSHHRMRASNDCLREIAVSSNVFENISHPCMLFLYLLLTNTWKTFLLTYVISSWFSAVHSLVKWLFRPAGCPKWNFHYLS